MATKEEILELLPKLLREDAAFREEVFSILTGNFATKEDIARILEELRRLREESERRFEAFERRQEEHSKRIEEHSKRIEEHSKRIEELVAEVKALVARVDRGFERFDRKLDAVGARFGVLAEGTFRNALRKLLNAHFGAEAARWIERDATGAVFGHPADVEIDVVVRNGAPILIEVKASASRADLALLKRKAAFYEERTGRKPVALYVVAGYHEPGTDRLAQALGITRLSDADLDQPAAP